MGISVKIGVACDGGYRNEDGTCEGSATLDAELSPDGLVKLPYRSSMDGWVFQVGHYGERVVYCASCAKQRR